MSPSRARASALAAALLIAGAAAAEPDRPGDLRAAREHFERGMHRYNVGEYDDAIVEFKLAYQRSDAPELLFNLAQAYRLKRDPAQALHLYRAYLRLEPDAPNRADAEARIAELEPLVDAPPSPMPPLVVSAAPSARAPGRPMVIAGLAVAGGGLVVLAAGIALGVEAQRKSDDLSQLAAHNGPWSGDSARAWQNGHDEAIAATVLYAVGGAAVGSGLLVTLLGVRKDHLARRLAVAPARGGAQVTATWRF